MEKPQDDLLIFLLVLAASGISTIHRQASQLDALVPGAYSLINGFDRDGIFPVQAITFKTYFLQSNTSLSNFIQQTSLWFVYVEIAVLSLRTMVLLMYEGFSYI